MKIVMSNPWLVVIDHVLSPQQCKEIIDIGERKFEPSEEGGDRYQGIRTSGHCFISREDYCPGVKKLCEVTSMLTKTPPQHAENGCIIKYNPGEEYKTHFDFFKDGRNKEDAEALKEGFYAEPAGDRLYSCIYYLNDDYKGGTTDFPEADIGVHPSTGRVVIFKNYIAGPDGKQILNMKSLHCGRKVLSGTKYIVTKWVRQKPFSPTWEEQLKEGIVKGPDNKMVKEPTKKTKKS